jgi:DNA (cytosine-5)-methyltransferase 1
MSQHQIGEKLSILNLYAGIGGNRKLWPTAVKVDAVEINPEIAAIYAELYPGDKVIVGDAHEYLADHYAEFDFIWTSPPCQSHSQVRHNLGVVGKHLNPIYPDMKLYQEIIFLRANAKCPWVVENVKPYYPPLIEGKVVGRHMFWSNFPLPMDTRREVENIEFATITGLTELYGIDIREYRLQNKRQVLRNCVDPKMGKAILDAALSGTVQQKLNLFNPGVEV